MSSAEIRIIDYSKLSIAVYNVPKKYEENFKQLGGLHNPKLSDGAGWLFHAKDRKKVEELVALANSGSLSPIPAVEKKKEAMEVTVMELLKRVEKLESEVSLLSQRVLAPEGLKGNRNLDVKITDCEEEKKEEDPVVVLPPSSSKGLIRIKKKT
jgi:hypothetical protein